MVDPLSMSIGAAAAFIAKPLIEAVGKHLAQSALPSLINEIKIRRDTQHLEFAHDLKDEIQAGRVKIGQFVEGTGFFSFYTVSHLPDVPLSWQVNSLLGGMMNAAMTGDASKIGNPIKFVLPTTKFPIVHDEFRVAFLYPHNMSGFAVPLLHDGSVEQLPFRGCQLCIVRYADALRLDNKIVHYRARVMQVGKSHLEAVYPGIRDDVYDQMFSAGMLFFLSAVEDDCGVDYFEESPRSLIAGSHFLETHWEIAAAVRDPTFRHVIGAAVDEAAGLAGIPKAQYAFERVNSLNSWHAPTYNIIQPNGLPYFHFQMNTVLNEHPERERIQGAFDLMSDHLITAVNTHYGTPGKKDLDSIDGYESPRHTILQSTAARTIEDPVLKAVRHWLEKAPAS